MSKTLTAIFVDVDDVVNHEALTKAGELNAVEEIGSCDGCCTSQATASLCSNSVVVTEGDCNARSIRGGEGVVRVEGSLGGDSANLFTFVDRCDDCGGNACSAVFSDCEGVARCKCCG